MKQTTIPTGYNTIMPYIIVPQANKLFDFIQEVFGAEEKMKVMHKDTDEIMHAELKIGESVIMLGNSSKEWTARTVSLFVYVENGDATFEKALSKGAICILPMEDKDYGRSGGVEDPFGNVWWITTGA